MGRIALVLVIVLGLVTMPLLSAQAASTGSAQALKRVEGLLDRSLREVRQAERFADQKHLGRIDRTTDQAIRLVRSTDKTIDNALRMVRRAGEKPLTKAQREAIERIVARAQHELRQAEGMVDKAAQQSEDQKRLREMFTRADQQLDEALKIIHQIVAGM
jgi:C4-type Zn-finger protein